MNERLTIKQSIIGALICLVVFVRGYIWLVTGQGFVNPTWQSVVISLQTTVSMYVGIMLLFNIDHERRKPKK